MDSLLGNHDPTELLVPLVVLFVFTIFTYLIYSGLFTSIEVDTKEPPYGPMLFAYKSATGPYKEAGGLFTETVCLMPNKTTMGIYYDDPDGVPADECRWDIDSIRSFWGIFCLIILSFFRYAVGCILSQEPAAASTEDMERMIAEGFHLVHLPKPNYCVWTSFPFRTTFSIIISIFRVYPKLKDYITSRGLCAYPAVEIYDGNQINVSLIGTWNGAK